MPANCRCWGILGARWPPGPDDPDARAAEAEARTNFEQLRAAPLLAHLDACMTGPVRRSKAVSQRAAEPVADPS